VAAFTQGTFAWGDYLERVFEGWLAAPNSLTLVAEAAGTVTGVARGSLLSPAEAWSQGLRVHPDHRRRGLGRALLEHLADWAAGKGARVMRLSAESGNRPALGLIGALGFRSVGSWLAAERPVAEPGPAAGGNGGRRVPAPQRLSPAPAAEADAAMLAWAGGPLEGAAHGLFPTEWAWRRLSLGDLEAAARRRSLWQAPSGWAVAEPDEGTLEVTWLCTYPDEARVMLRALADVAASAGAERLHVYVPAVDWLRTVLDGAGWEVHPVEVLARAL